MKYIEGLQKGNKLLYIKKEKNKKNVEKRVDFLKMV